MLDWLKYSNIRFKQKTNDLIIPVGPKFSRAKKLELPLGGSTLCLNIPKHSPPNSSYEEWKNKGDVVSKFSPRDYSESYLPSQNWQYINVISRVWGFNGAWVGASGNIKFSISALFWKEQVEGSSLFHPNSFELAISNYLNSFYGFRHSNGKASWEGPINWKPLDGFPMGVAKFDVKPNEIGDYTTIVMLPISDSVIIQLKFITNQAAGNCNLLERDKLVDRSPMNLLISEIIESLEFHLSDEARIQLDNISEGLDGMTLSKVFSPLEWPVDKQDQRDNIKSSLLLS